MSKHLYGSQIPGHGNRRPRYYMLLRQQTVPTEDVLAWAEWIEGMWDECCVVAQTELGGVAVSTVFLGIDHSISDDDPPELFETMVFGGSLDQEMKRYASWDQAEAGHLAMVQRVERENGNAR